MGFLSIIMHVKKLFDAQPRTDRYEISKELLIKEKRGTLMFVKRKHKASLEKTKIALTKPRGVIKMDNSKGICFQYNYNWHWNGNREVLLDSKKLKRLVKFLLLLCL